MGHLNDTLRRYSCAAVFTSVLGEAPFGPPPGSSPGCPARDAGNAEGALGDWDSARVHYLAAAEDPEIAAIAGANFALASFEVGDTEAALRSARQLLRRSAQRAGLDTAHLTSLAKRPELDACISAA